VIKMRRAQLTFGDGLIAAEVDDLCEDWMRRADQVLADELLVAAVYEALGKRRPKSRSRGRVRATLTRWTKRRRKSGSASCCKAGRATGRASKGHPE
jgi:hypothetical protein